MNKAVQHVTAVLRTKSLAPPQLVRCGASFLLKRPALCQEEEQENLTYAVASQSWPIAFAVRQKPESKGWVCPNLCP